MKFLLASAAVVFLMASWLFSNQGGFLIAALGVLGLFMLDRRQR